MARVLIWNRGEIAVRIAIAAERLGVTSIAALTPVDIDSRVVEHAHEILRLPSSDAASTYLSLDAVRAAITDARATHVHPGYGFLAESAEFARVVAESGAVLVGPSEALLAEMASKSASKAFARDAGLDELGLAFDDATGRFDGVVDFPLLLKADAGGGGRGNKLVSSEAELESAIDALRARSGELFGSRALLAERFLRRARHIELQLFGIPGRGVRVLDSRDCSVQRHHQKVVEEGPAPNRALAAIGPVRLGVERALSRRGFRGAGTLELLYDEDTGKVFFLELNPRIQVEHPVTEQRLGIDLVEWQLRESLGIDASALFDELDAPRCHSIEFRIYAEDVDDGYLPDPGFVHVLERPTMPWARWDSAQRSGARVPEEYDPMIAKLVVIGATRDEAVIHARIALDHTHVHGVRTNLDLLRAIVAADEFVADRHTIGWLDENRPSLAASSAPFDLAPIRALFEAARPEDALPRTTGLAWKDAHRR